MKFDHVMILVTMGVIVTAIGGLGLFSAQSLSEPASQTMVPIKEIKVSEKIEFTDMINPNAPTEVQDSIFEEDYVLYSKLIGTTWYVVECEKGDLTCPKAFDRASIRQELNCKTYDLDCDTGVAEYKVLRDDKWYDVKCDVYDSKCPQNFEPEDLN